MSLNSNTMVWLLEMDAKATSTSNSLAACPMTHTGERVDTAREHQAPQRERKQKLRAARNAW